MQNELSRSSLPISEQETQFAKKGVYVYVKSMSLVNEERTGNYLRQVEHIRGHL
jgi:hypothetical protein